MKLSPIVALCLTLAACAVPVAPEPERATGEDAAAMDRTCGNWRAGYIAITYPPGERGPEPGGDDRCAAPGNRDRFGAEPATMGAPGEWSWWCCPPCDQSGNTP